MIHNIWNIIPKAQLDSLGVTVESTNANQVNLVKDRDGVLGESDNCALGLFIRSNEVLRDVIQERLSFLMLSQRFVTY